MMLGGGGGRGREERVPQWGPQETRELIGIRGELERHFSASKRNKTLWEAVASRMRDRGYRRTPDQCKCKWKNLVNRYKGKETSDPENGRQCPFFEELHAVFTERARNMQRQLLESEHPGGPSSTLKKKPKRSGGDRSSDELSDEDNDEEEEEEGDSGDERPATSRKRKAERDKPKGATSSTSNSIHDLLQGFLQQQQRMDVQWREMMERRAHERLLFEQEWRQSMEKLERERLMMEQAWREREEQRRIREEMRAEKRDALLTTLLNKLLQDNL
ncbi:trihelix transcription factor GT-3b-like [Ananas comosus]|uniref:Trihelix transcription factor GT-3b-like n=1 Tax=Ananas comosus TaxID=4615 RepID=A0A6P5ERM3_ANACO|nr:trihelix transcription factor GT-3b-like [Ananas comosus]